MITFCYTLKVNFIVLHLYRFKIIQLDALRNVLAGCGHSLFIDGLLNLEICVLQSNVFNCLHFA